jgi:predicted nucleic acid-binding protein
MATPKRKRASRKVFLDSHGWIALLNAADELHERADALWKKLGEQHYQVIVTDWIVAETGNGLARTRARSRFVRIMRALLQDPRATFVRVDAKLLVRALELYEHRSDKEWGLVDCASILVMEDHDIREAFTYDKHFKQAGFECLLM